MHTISIQGTDYLIPSRWDELSAIQLRRIAWLSTLQKEGVALSKLFFYILTSSLPWWKRIRLRYFFLVQASTDERGDFLTLVDSFSQFRSFTQQIQEKIRVRTVLLYGPASGLSNCTFYEYIQAEQYFLNYQNKKNGQMNEWLDRVIATLYRQKRKGYDPANDPDPRIALNDVGIRYRLGLLKVLDEPTKLAVLMWFDGCRQHLINRFPLIFQQPKAKPVGKWNASQQSSSSAEGWLTLISELSGSMDNYEVIGNTNLYTALTDISFRIKKNKEAERTRAMQNRKRK